MNRREIKKWAKSELKDNYFNYLKPVLFLFAFIVVSGRIMDIIDNIFISDIVGFVLNLLLIPLTLGALKYYLKACKKQKLTTDDLFSLYKKPVRLIITILFSGLVMVGGYIFFIIPGIYFSFALALVPYLLVTKRKVKSFDILEESIKTMKGHKVELFKFELSFLLWHIVSISSFGLLYLYVMPYYLLARTKLLMSFSDEDEVIVA